MKMAVFSDSHGNYKFLSRALSCALEKGAEVLVHLGDYYDDLCSHDCGGAQVYRVPGLPSVDSFNPAAVETVARFTFAGRSVIAIHDRGGLSRHEGEGSLILYGHTHKADCALEADGRWYLNPGHLKAPVDRGGEASFALISVRAEKGLACDILSPDGKVLFSCPLDI
jgi:hypothetical protein